jgi:hypothetical protein
MDKKHAELIVKIIAVGGYIGAGLGVIAGLALLFGGSFIAGLMPMADIPSFAGALVGAVAVVMAIICIAFSVFVFIVSKNIWNHKNWARIAVIILAALGGLSALFHLPSGIIGLILDGAVVYFLGFDKTVIKLFK